MAAGTSRASQSAAGSPARRSSPCRSGDGRGDVGIPTKEVRGIVPVLEGQEPAVIRAEYRWRARFGLVGLVVGVDAFARRSTKQAQPFVSPGQSLLVGLRIVPIGGDAEVDG